MRYLEEAELDDLALGATLLGTGGGGDPFVARIVAGQAIRDHGPIKIMGVDELDDDALVVTIAGVGAPTVLIEKLPSGKEFVAALTALETYLGRKVDAVMPVEVGGMNTLIPLVVAAELGIPCLDADGMRRAFPQIEMTAFTLGGIQVSPLTLADEKGNRLVIEAQTNQLGEKLVRGAVMTLGMSNAMASYSMSGKDAKEWAISGSIEYCLTVGALLREIHEGREGAWEKLLGFTGGRRVFEGKVIDLERRTTEGFARGTLIVEDFDDTSRTMRIELQNELLLATENGRPVVTPPDLICVVDHETGAPITTEALGYGQRVTVLGLPCAPEWRRDGYLDLVGPKAFGYDVPYSPMEG